MALIRPICAECKRNPGRSKGKDKHGRCIFTSFCSGCSKRRRREGRQGRANDPLTPEQWRQKRSRLNSKRRRHRAFVKPACERCGFVPEHMAQLEVDHIDMNRWNNDPINLQTLCANCHRLKTMMERGLYRENDPLMVVGA